MTALVGDNMAIDVGMSSLPHLPPPPQKHWELPITNKAPLYGSRLCFWLQHLLSKAHPMDDRIDINQYKFLSRKKRIIEEVQARPLTGFMLGRLDSETEWENEAENSIKDLSFGRVYHFGANSQLDKALEEGDHKIDLESSKQNPEVKPKQIDDGTKELEQPLKKRCTSLAELNRIRYYFKTFILSKDLFS
ncbi:hypothetical protein BY996DRAFT_8512718 [Phakopsora pachyrhizi]|nr:hypothetical protein BY996DRAFT_8512718 [Phakopsora pachyrhizi]